jgi:hypothetical protein
MSREVTANSGWKEKSGKILNVTKLCCDLLSALRSSSGRTSMNSSSLARLCTILELSSRSTNIFQKKKKKKRKKEKRIYSLT